MQIHGAILSPFVRKVLVVAELKGLEYEQLTVLPGSDDEAFRRISPLGKIPALTDGDFSISDSSVICEYLEELHPDGPLVGADPESRAMTRMWLRRIEYRITQPLGEGFRSAEGLALFKDRRHCIPQAADDFKASGREGLAWLEQGARIAWIGWAGPTRKQGIEW